MLVVALAIGILSNMRTPLYKATARVLLTPNDPTQQLNPISGNGVVGNDPDRYVAGQIDIVQSEGVAEEAVKSLSGITTGEVERKVSVSQRDESNVLKISATDPNPARARDIAQAVAAGYIENRRLAAVSGLKGAADDIEAKLGPLQSQIAQLDSQIGEGSTAPNATSGIASPSKPTSASPPASPTPQVSQGSSSFGGVPTTQESLKAARYAAAVQYETLYSRQQELLVDISLKRGDAELIADAKLPTAPVSPHPKRDGALGAFMGLLLGVGISLLREQLNDRVRSANEVEELSGLPVLAHLPYDEDAAKSRADRVAITHRSMSPLSEAVRALRTSIQYLSVDKPLKVIVVTSAGPGEGKSLVSANLAAAFAQADYRTLLVSADLRRSSIEMMFSGEFDSSGLTGVLAPLAISGKNPAMHVAGANGNGSHPRGVREVALQALVDTSILNLLLLPAGPTPPNPAELLGSHRMAEILEIYGQQTDIIIIDSPPLLPVTDAAVLAAKSDGVVLVTALNETRRDATTRARAILEGTGARLLGVVANKSRAARKNQYYAGYYSAESERDTKRGRRRRSRAFVTTL